LGLFAGSIRGNLCNCRSAETRLAASAAALKQFFPAQVNSSKTGLVATTLQNSLESRPLGIRQGH
jgi:hypothetical protein